MKKINYHLQLGSTEACTKRTTEATKGIGQRDVKGATKDCLFFAVGYPQRILQKLQWMLV